MLLAAVMILALVQGIVFIALIPPWQHYDEPTHFEYSALIVQQRRLHPVADSDPVLRREIAASMLEHRFWTHPPTLFPSDGLVGLGASELVHPPLYYWFAGLPLRITKYLDVTTQLYLMRCMSLLLFCTTIAFTIGIMRDLVPPGHVLRWAVPLAVVLLPTIPDLMTAVNNDVGAITIFSAFLWAGIRTIRYGPNIGRISAICVAVIVGTWTKSTVASVLILVPLVTILSARQRFLSRLRKPWLIAAILLLTALLSLLRWDDAALWYRPRNRPMGHLGTRGPALPATPAVHPLMLDARSQDFDNFLISVVRTPSGQNLAGKTVTVGGWMWASAPMVGAMPGVVLSSRDHQNLLPLTEPVTLTTEPAWVSWTIKLPKEPNTVYYALFGTSYDGTNGNQIYLQQPVLIEGSFNGQPSFDTPAAVTGTWNGTHWTNPVRNAGGQAVWPRWQPVIEHLASRIIRRPPTHMLEILLDIRVTGRFLWQVGTTDIVPGLFNAFAWGHIELKSSGWIASLWFISIVGAVGCLKWLMWDRRKTRAINGSLFLMMAAMFMVWTFVMVWPLQFVPAMPMIPSARYGFVAIVPTMLAIVGGWWMIVPQRWRPWAISSLLLVLLIFQTGAIWTIWTYYHSVVPAT
ncbi:MAG: hypothetical protein NVS2B7_16610 [Herpetosiphon sp.]